MSKIWDQIPERILHPYLLVRFLKTFVHPYLLVIFLKVCFTHICWADARTYFSPIFHNPAKPATDSSCTGIKKMVWPKSHSSYCFWLPLAWNLFEPAISDFSNTSQVGHLADVTNSLDTANQTEQQSLACLVQWQVCECDLGTWKSRKLGSKKYKK